MSHESILVAAVDTWDSLHYSVYIIVHLKFSIIKVLKKDLEKKRKRERAKKAAIGH